MSRVKTVKAAPGARRLVESLRDLGYDTSTAIADLIDNSINADSSEIQVEIRAKSGSTPAHVVIADDGKGMSADALKNAMRFGSHQEYSLEDLGKYGLGLKTASLSQCGLLSVLSKPRQKSGSRSRLSIAQWDVAHLNKTDDWDLKTPDIEELPQWKQEILSEFMPEDGGTVVIWSELEEALPLLESDNPKKSENEVARLFTECSAHIRMVFHRFMEGRVSGTRKLNITLCGQELEAWDPFCRTEKTKELTPERWSISSTGGQSKGQKHKIVLQPYILPRQDEFTSKEAFKEASGIRNWNFQQGFYFYRNNRLIQAGGWSNLRAPDEHSKLLRIAVDFNAALDDSLAINITKMRARIPVEVREEIKNYVTRWIKPAEERYRGRSGGGKSKSGGATKTAARASTTQATASAASKTSAINIGAVSLVPSNTSSTSLAVAKGARPGQLKIIVPQSHICSDAFSSSGRDAELKQTCLMLLGVIEGIVLDQVDPDEIPLDSLKRQVRKIL